MIRFENECVGCPKEMGCINCSYSRVVHLICDSCEQESDKLYNTDEGQICQDCVEETYPVIDHDNALEFTSPEEQDYGDPDMEYEMKRDERWEENHG